MTCREDRTWGTPATCPPSPGLCSLDGVKMYRAMSTFCLPGHIHVVVCHIFKAP